MLEHHQRRPTSAQGESRPMVLNVGITADRMALSDNHDDDATTSRPT
jgi:hypothetical protein